MDPTMKAVLNLWPVIVVLAGGIWWAAETDAKLNDLQAYIAATAQHTNNLDYTLHNGP